jgi:hypothetical protein
MIIYLLHPTSSEVRRKLCLVLCLSTPIVPRIDVLLGIAPIVCLLMICTPSRLGTCSGCVAVLHIETARETHVHVAVSFDDVGVHWGRVSCRRVNPRHSRNNSWHDACTHPTLARQIVGEWGAWCSASTWNDNRGPSTTPMSGPSASLRVSTWLKGSNGWNVEMCKGGIVCRGRVARCVCVRIGHHLLHHRLLPGVQLLDS